MRNIPKILILACVLGLSLTSPDLANAGTKTPSSAASFCSFACTVGCVTEGYFGGYCVGGSCHCNGAETQ